MRVLLDSHAFIWWAQDPDKLSPTAQSIFNDEQNLLYLSMASIWEMQIKVKLGKLTLTPSLNAVVNAFLQTDQVKLFAIRLWHIFALDRLPDHHRDPFDRLLIAQALHERLPIISSDPLVAQYPIQAIW